MNFPHIYYRQESFCITLPFHVFRTGVTHHMDSYSQRHVERYGYFSTCCMYSWCNFMSWLQSTHDVLPTWHWICCTRYRFSYSIKPPCIDAGWLWLLMRADRYQKPRTAHVCLNSFVALPNKHSVLVLFSFLSHIMSFVTSAGWTAAPKIASQMHILTETRLLRASYEPKVLSLS
jgi:hypothetical protein